MGEAVQLRIRIHRLNGDWDTARILATSALKAYEQSTATLGPDIDLRLKLLMTKISTSYFEWLLLSTRSALEEAVQDYKVTLLPSMKEGTPEWALQMNNYADALAALAGVTGRTDLHDEAIDAQRKSAPVLNKLGDPDLNAFTASNMADALTSRGSKRGEIVFLQQAIDIYRPLYLEKGLSPETTAKIANGYANALAAMAQFTKKQKYFEDSLAVNMEAATLLRKQDDLYNYMQSILNLSDTQILFCETFNETKEYCQYADANASTILAMPEIKNVPLIVARAEMLVGEAIIVRCRSHGTCLRGSEAVTRLQAARKLALGRDDTMVIRIDRLLSRSPATH